MLDDLFQEGKKMLPSISKSIDYEAIVGKLILQGMYQLMEERVVIECASGELQLVTRAAKKAQQDYQQSLNLNVEYTIQEGLKESGVVLSVKEGKIRVKNTLEARLDLLSEFMLPDIRILLFGVSENRAFYN